MGLFSSFSAMNPLLSAVASVGIQKLTGNETSASQLMDTSRFENSFSKDRAFAQVEKAQKQANERSKYLAPSPKKTDMNSFVRDAILPAFREVPDFKSQLIRQAKSQGMPNSVIKEIEYDFEWTESKEGERIKR